MYARCMHFSGGERDGAGAAPASEFGLGREPGRITDLDDEGGGVDRSDPGLVAQRCAVLVEEAVDVVLESVDL
jgi:hypothetical protein